MTESSTSSTVTKIDVAQPSYVLSPQTPFVGSIGLGQPFTLTTLDASGNQLRPGIAIDRIDASKLFPVTGPIYVEGIEAGMTTGLGIIDIRCATTGYVWTRPGLGFKNPDLLALRRFDVGPGVVKDHPSGLCLDYQPHTGALGVLPSYEVPGRTLGKYGGNLDVAGLGPGAVLWVQSAVTGGGVFAGDVHAAIGDGEVCGTGVETASEVDLVALAADWSVDHPTVMTGDRVWLIGVGETVEDAMGNVIPDLVQMLAVDQKTDADQAYLLASVLLDIRICQVVNPLTSVAISLRKGLDRCLVPPQAHADYALFRSNQYEREEA